MAVSRDDKYVALTMKYELQVYNMSVKPMKRVWLGEVTNHNAYFSNRSPVGAYGEALELERQKTVLEQKLHFAADSRRFILATYLGDHRAYVDVWDCKDQDWEMKPSRSRLFQLPPVRQRF